jgi:hypothetical protein
MDTITAVVELVRENEDLNKTLEMYESWFEGLIGQTVTLSHKSKNKTRYVTCEVEEFEEGQGWLVRDIETDEVFTLSFEKLFDGSATINKMPDPVKRTVRFVQ